ncbi:MAG TPA: phage holin family protein [Steroidobacteraceae bacterium]
MRNSTQPTATTAASTSIHAVSIKTTGVLRILRTAGGALLLQAALHGQLLRVEWAEEKSRLLKLVMATLLGFVCLLGLLAALGVLLLALYWDTPYRILAVSVLMAFYGLGMALAWRLFSSQAALASCSFAASRSELAADLELLRSQL